MRREELELEAALEKHQISQIREKGDAENSHDKVTKNPFNFSCSVLLTVFYTHFKTLQSAGQDAAIDFFTKVWDPEPTVLGSPAPLSHQEEGTTSPSSSGSHLT